MITINLKIQPLIEDLGSIVPGKFLVSTAYKRWLIESGLETFWSQCVDYVRVNRHVVVFGYDHDAADAKEALDCMVNLMYEQEKAKLPRFLFELLSTYITETSTNIDATNIKKDLHVAGYSNKDISEYDNLPVIKPIERKDKDQPMQDRSINPSVDSKKIKKSPMVFISHSHADEDFVIALVNLLEDIGLNTETLFCSSVSEYGVQLSGDIFETIRELFLKHDLYVIFVHSPRFYSSAVALNEMGAAWVLKSDFCSFLTNDMEYEKMTGVVNNAKLSIKVDENVAPALMNKLYEHLVKLFSLKKMDISKWERKRNQFLASVK
jgi:hypothetical protein